MTIDVKRGRELEAAATPGSWVVYPHDNGAWLAERTHHAVGDPDAPDTRLGETGLADADLIAWLRNNCTALLSAAERVEAAERRVAEYSHMADAAERARDEALRRAEAARAILNKWCLPSLCVAGCKCAACRIRATLDPKGGK